MKIEEIRDDAIWYYNLGGMMEFCVQYMVKLDEDIDADILRNALDTTMLRYPYLMKELKANEKGYTLVDNPRPVVIVPGHEKIAVCGKEANFHQFVVSYEGKWFFINAHHGLFDGGGRTNFLHTLIYYYCKEKYNEDVEMPGVYLVDTPIDPGEYASTYDVDFSDVTEEEPLDDVNIDTLDLMKMGRVNPSKCQIHSLRISEKQLMACCKTMDATPNTAISTLLARAIYRVHPDCEQTIVPGVAVNMKKALGIPKTHLSEVTSVSLKFTPEMKNMDFSEQNTILRGQLMLASTPEKQRQAGKKLFRISEEINAESSLSRKKEAALKGMIEMLASPKTFTISYANPVNYGSCEKHIEHVYSNPGSQFPMLLLELTVANGWFFINWTQGWHEEVYFNAFLKEAISLGLDFDLLYTTVPELIKCDLPTLE